MKKNKRLAGYILAESMLAFFVMSLMIVHLIPLLVLMRQQEQANLRKLEASRYLYELTVAYQSQGEIPMGTIERRGLELRSSGSFSPLRVEQVQVEVAGDSYAIIWQGSESN